MSTIANLHTTIAPFEVRDGCLCVGGKTVVDIMSSLESVPAYLYDAELIKQRIQSLRKALPDAISLHYAMKANPMPEVVNLVAGLVDGLDIASAGELKVALQSGCDPKDMSFAGPGKQDWELKAAIDAGITINVESPNELERIAALSVDGSANVALRVNPDFELKSSGMKMSGGPKPFGIDSEMIPGVLVRLGQLPVQFRGFHVFTGAQNLRPESICEAQIKSLELALTELETRIGASGLRVDDRTRSLPCWRGRCVRLTSHRQESVQGPHLPGHGRWLTSSPVRQRQFRSGYSKKLPGRYSKQGWLYPD
jgi:diaminopimelate decarboxylase